MQIVKIVILEKPKQQRTKNSTKLPEESMKCHQGMFVLIVIALIIVAVVVADIKHLRNV